MELMGGCTSASAPTCWLRDVDRHLVRPAPSARLLCAVALVIRLREQAAEGAGLSYLWLAPPAARRQTRVPLLRQRFVIVNPSPTMTTRSICPRPLCRDNGPSLWPRRRFTLPKHSVAYSRKLVPHIGIASGPMRLVRLHSTRRLRYRSLPNTQPRYSSGRRGDTFKRLHNY